MKKGKTLFIVVAVTLLLISLSLYSASPAEWPPPMPKIINVATDTIGSTFHLQSAKIADCIFRKFGFRVRLTPVGTDVNAFMAAKTKLTDCYASSSGIYAATDGFGEFASIKLGPQPIRYIYICRRQAGFSPVTNRESGIKTMADVKGKRVTWILGHPGTNRQTEAYLAYAGLTWKDVEIVKCPTYAATVRSVMEGKADMASASTDGPVSFELESSNRGIYWIPLPASNVEGWKRVQALFPLFEPVLCSVGAGIDPKKPIEIGTSAGPTWATFDWLDEGISYWIAKLIAESYEGMDHPSWWTLNANLNAARCAPFHKGAIKYFKEKGVWTEKQEKIDEYYTKRQKILIEAFESAKLEAEKKGIKENEFPDFWETKKVEALKRAGL